LKVKNGFKQKNAHFNCINYDCFNSSTWLICLSTARFYSKHRASKLFNTNLIAGFLVLFGSVLLVARYVRTKLESPTIPFEGTTPRLTFLTLGLEMFIGAEIINTATTRTLEDFLLLSLTIATRGLIGLILYLEKKSSSH